MVIQLAKGVKDYTFEEMIKRQDLISKLKNVFERYGFSPFETPVIERFELLASKFAAGDESDAMKEVFKLSDQGMRKLGLRFELTLSMCRYIAMNPNTKLPFKRYEIGRVYRDGPIKLGRMREFIQCDVDIVGSKNMLADAEIMKLGIDVLKELELDAFIEVNNRKLLKGLLESCEIDEDKKIPSIISIDKLNKIGKNGVKKELASIGVNSAKSDKLLSLLSYDGSFSDTIWMLKKTIKDSEGIEGINEIEELFSYLSKADLKNIKFNLSLARGLSYYTGTIFEGFLRNSKVTSAICGGGRYDNMIKMLLKTNKPYPALGISFGIVPILEAINLHLKKDSSKVVTKLLVISIGNTINKSLDIVRKIRNSKISADIDIMKRSISKNLKYANSLSIPYVLFVGEDEIKSRKFKLKDMNSGDEGIFDLKELIKKLK